LPLPEMDYTLRTIDDIALVIEAAGSIGVSQTTARGVGAWAVVHTGMPDETTDSSRSRYRKILKQLVAEDKLPAPSRPGAYQPGHSRLRPAGSPQSSHGLSSEGKMTVGAQRKGQ
jgi:hypothetical protein